MTQDEKNVKDIFDTKPDERIKTNTGGYTKIEDGQTVKMRVTLDIYRYYTVKPKDTVMPMMNNDLRELLKETTIDKLFEDEDYEIGERYAFVIYNHTTEQPEVWQVSRTVFNNLRTLHRDEDWDGGLPANDIKVTRTGKGTDTTYTMSFAPKSEPLNPQQEAELLEVDVEKMVAGSEKL